MNDNSELPMLPSIDIYKLRCIFNNITSFNKNIINYDYIIYGRIKEIAKKTEKLNELIRNAIPILKIKINYIINNDLDENTNNNESNTDDICKTILTTNFIEDLIDAKTELEKLNFQIRDTIESLLAFHLNENNKLKLSQYVSQKELLVISRNSKQEKLNEINHQYSIITAAEDVILKAKITDFFNKYLLGKELIDSIDLPMNKKQILKSAIIYVRNLLLIVDDGQEITQLVDARLYLSAQIIELKEEINSIDNNISQLSQLILLANEVSAIDTYKLSIVTQIGLLKNYWESWCKFSSKQASEQPLNIPLINTASQMLITYLNDMEYQYQRQLSD
ncbi:hypothetical protein MASR2M36_17070 [Providencia sp.]